MDFESVTRLLLENFKKMGVDCALIGGFALHSAGITRATKDIDFLVKKSDASKIKEFMLKNSYQLIHESEDVSNYWSDLKPLGNVDFLHAHRKYSLAMLERAVEKEILSGRFKVKVVLPEDIVGLKLQASVNDPKRLMQDMADIRTIIEINHRNLDMDLLREYFILFEKEKEFNLILENLDNAQ